MFSLFQFLATVAVIILILSAYLGYQTHKKTGELPLGVESDSPNDVTAYIALWFAYVYLGLTIIVVFFKDKFTPGDKGG